MNLSRLDKNAIFRMRKHGRLREIEPGWWGATESFSTTRASTINKLVVMGIFKRDRVGDVVLAREPTEEEKSK